MESVEINSKTPQRPEPSLKGRFALWLTMPFVLLVCSMGCGKRENSNSPNPQALRPETALRVEQFCGNCHPLPDPSSFPKSNWPAEVERGFRFYYDSERKDLDVPVALDAVKYFQSQAPEALDIPDASTFPLHPTSVKFTESALVISGDPKSLTADIKWDSQSKSLLFSDMANGKLSRWAPKQSPEFFAKSGADLFTLDPSCVKWKSNHLCRMTPCDWNADGLEDLLVAEIGSMIISDQKLGCVSLCLGKESGDFERIVLVKDLARPVEATPFDYDDDGDLDIVIAEFGYIKAGCLSLLRNQSQDPKSQPSPETFTYEVIDSRHGQLCAIVADLDGDSRNDLITTLGQEYESIQVRYNRGKGEYENQLIAVMPDPSYNTSAIRVADVDGDGRLDILHTCGDIFDSFVPKPFHGVRWIRNEGNGRWEVRELGMLIGAMQAVAADFDADGDQDIAAVGLFPVSRRSATGTSYDSVCWWEQTPGLNFVRHSIERDRCLHSSCLAADVDSDGRTDLVVGEWAEGKTPASLRIFWNRPR
jgi:hypothetical protein